MMYRYMFLVLWMTFCSILNAKSPSLSSHDARYIAEKIWQNEGAKKDKYLIWWNEGEDFASVGIGHFIWFPKGHTERFREVFPMVIAYMKQYGVQMPSWLDEHTDLPWGSKQELNKAKQIRTKKYMELFNFLKKTFDMQAAFMVARTEASLALILQHVKDQQKKEKIKRRFQALLYQKDGSIDPHGAYILVDYVNFKGEGTLPSERYKGEGWGLLQVLEHIDEDDPDKYRAFALSARKMLERRIENSPPQRGEKRWHKGWMKRLETYYWHPKQ